MPEKVPAPTPAKTATKSSTKNFSIPDFFLAFFPAFLVYLLTLFPTVGTEDSGELITSAAKLDIAHPSGYPLHTLLGHLFTIIIPFGNIGWRVNVMSAFFGALTVGMLFLLLKRLIKNDLIALTISLFFAFSDIFWSQSIRAEVYTLHTFILSAIAYLLLLWDQTGENKFLYLTALAFGLGISDHHMILLAAPPAFIFVIIRNWKILIKPKIIAICLLLLALGLCCYAYLPIRTALGPYDNPAYISHEGLYTWDKFINFVNRGIYGGTLSLSSSQADSQQTQGTLQMLITVEDTFMRYISNMVNNNVTGLLLMLKNIVIQLLYLPLLLFLPGLYYLFRKYSKYAVFICLLFIFYTTVQLTFIGVSANMHPFTIFSNRPFYLSSVFVLVIVCGAGLQFLANFMKNRKGKSLLTFVLILLPLCSLAANFSSNNESRNYIAHDFSLNLLNSLPKNAHLLSTGKDNLTFPLYYLRNIEGIRPDVDLEIYYSRKCADRQYLEGKLYEKNIPVLFIDLLPCGYNDLNLIPYNFVYAFGETGSLPAAARQFEIRGIRKKMDYPNDKLKGLYYLKMAILNANDSAVLDYYFNKIKIEIPENDQFKNFITDYRTGKDDTGMF